LRATRATGGEDVACATELPAAALAVGTTGVLLAAEVAAAGADVWPVGAQPDSPSMRAPATLHATAPVLIRTDRDVWMVMADLLVRCSWSTVASHADDVVGRWADLRITRRSDAVGDPSR
jgi:hypothetical protein